MNASGTCARLLSPASLALDGFATEPVSLMSIRIIKHVLPDGRLQSADHSWQADAKAGVIDVTSLVGLKSGSGAKQRGGNVRGDE